MAFEDITAFYKTLEAKLTKKLRIDLVYASTTPSFFTGLCVNKSALWLSIREPHRTNKANEHVREWRRGSSSSAEKMINWYIGIVEYLDSKAPNRKVLKSDS